MRTGSMSITLTLLMAGALLVGACQSRGGSAPPPPSTAPGPAPGAAQGPGLQRNTLHTLVLPTLRQEDLSHADPANFAAALGKDPDRIFAFIRDSIAFEAYRGLLRGPRGTLLAAAGNSVDRAALLAAMLEKAGQRVRFARGTLDERHARDLVMSMWAQREELPAGPLPDVPADIKAILDILPTAARRDLSLIRDRLTALGIQSRRDSVPSVEALVQETQQHYWVQWSKDGQWIDLDPSFADARPGQAYAKNEEVLPTLPESLAHQVRVRVKVEEYADAQASSREILTFSARAAELSAVDLILVHVPENWKGPATSLTGGISEAVSSTGRIRPVLLMKTQYVTGEAFQPPGAARGIGSIGRLLGGAQRGAAIATAEFLELEFVDPAGSTETVSREIYDAIGPARRAASQSPSADDLQRMEIQDLTNGGYSLYVTTGRVDAGQVQTASRPAPSPTAGDGIDVREELNRLHLAFVAASDFLMARVTDAGRVDILFYPVSPRVTILDLVLRRDTARLRLDLRRTRARAVAAGAHPEDTVFARIQRGVIEGTLERVLLTLWTRGGSRDIRPGTAFGTSMLFEAAQSQGLQMLALPGERNQIGGDVPQDALARLDADVARGHVAVVPQRAPLVDGTPRYAWWRIDPASGETTAVTDEGLHGAAEQEGVRVLSRTNVQTGAPEFFWQTVTLTGWRSVMITAEELARMGGIPGLLQLLRAGGIPYVPRP